MLFFSAPSAWQAGKVGNKYRIVQLLYTESHEKGKGALFLRWFSFDVCNVTTITIIIFANWRLDLLFEPLVVRTTRTHYGFFWLPFQELSGRIFILSPALLLFLPLCNNPPSLIYGRKFSISSARHRGPSFSHSQFRLTGKKLPGSVWREGKRFIPLPPS